MVTQVWEYAPQLIGALLILVAGWILALAVAAIVRTALRKTSLDNRLCKWFLDKERADSVNIEQAAGQVTFWLLLALVIVAFLQAMGLTLAVQPLNSMLSQVFDFIPRLIGATVLLLLAWLTASGMRLLITRAVGVCNLEERLGDKEEPGGTSLADSFGEIVYWLVFVLFLPAMLGALALDGLLDPVRSMTQRFLDYMPSLFAAVAIVILGLFVARVVQRLAIKLFGALGVDQLSERVGLAPALGGKKLSVALGLLVQVLILIPVAIAALNALALDSLTQPASHMLGLIIGTVPSILGATLILLFSYVVGRLAASVVTNLLESVGFNTIPARLGLACEEPTEGKRTLSQFVGCTVVVIAMFFATVEAAHLLGLSAFAGFAADLIVLGGHVLLGVAILALGLWVANLAAETIKSTDKPQAGKISAIARVAILTLAVAIALRQMGLANEIISLAFGLVLGAGAVASALAFGIGGRDVAKRKLEEWLD